MIPAWSVVLVALAYLCALFAVAHIADTSGRRLMTGRWRATIYALALGVYCTSWTFYGSVGFASRAGFDFLGIYVGPILVIGLGHRFVERLVSIAKSQNITSIADFVGARYGKSERVAALVCIVAVIGALPYIALQLKAVANSLSVFLAATGTHAPTVDMPLLGDLPLLVALVLAGFACAFGTRHIDATEHQDGLVLAIAVESLVKLVAFLVLGVFVVYGLFGGSGELLARAAQPLGNLPPIWERTSSWPTFLTLTLLSSCAALLLARQFHMTIVENRDVRDVRRAAWMFPLYLVLINLFVLPLAAAGEILMPGGGIDRDMTVLLLPLQREAGLVALAVFVGGLSAATAMVIVASVALAIMISNHLVMPLLLRGRRALGDHGRNERPTTGDGVQSDAGGDLGSQLVILRRVSIVVVILLGYLYYRASGEAALVSIGLLSFAATAQIAPAFLGGLIWRRGTALGAAAGLIVGTVVWAYTLLMPSLVIPGSWWSEMVTEGPFGAGVLRPESLLGLGLPPLAHGVFWSLGLNILAYVGFSLLRPANAMERLQANAFVESDRGTMAQTFSLWRTSVTESELQATIARYLGRERTERAFESFNHGRGEEPDAARDVDIHLLRFGEHLLSSAIGAASSRLVLSLLLKRRNLTTEAAFKLLDDASAALQYNRDILQHGLDHAGQGITVLDRDLRLLAWNQAFLQLYDLPPSLVRFGTGLDEIVRYNAARGAYGDGARDELMAARLESFVRDREPVRLKLYPSKKVIEVRTNSLPDGGFVTTYTDITETVAGEEELERTNESLERRVAERTEELLHVNAELQRAKAEAEAANASKTRFLAAASHDILQPLNAARLYATSLVERDRNAGQPDLAENIDASLDAVEEILTALLEISRLDGGALKPEITAFRLDELMRQLQREFEPSAQERGLKLVFMPTGLAVRSDRRLLRRLLQNLVSNAIKYTPNGKVLVGCRRRGNQIALEVLDTGLGIPQSKQKTVFREFQRLDQGARVARGLGLGLSIVQRIARALDHGLTLDSAPGRGTRFSLLVPRAAPLPAMSTGAAPRQTPAGQLAGMRLLVIDNEPTILDGMKRLLEGWGCRVTIAPGLDEALPHVGSRNEADVLIADYHLDHGNGLTAISALRARARTPMPAILLTADRSPQVREAAAALDVHLLNKPLKPAALRALLAQWRATRLAAE
ncbi:MULTISPECIES: PAS domain-containing hybrid sensor histidine kinase/response regulator [unclassified Bosea (in: a-proteobacteria)]|uniref:hybrid sensor histidine kinase/response regulator n=1 Tax=unclassified Bosea (in: a-proteobacteria) TaxID=2653178 RepID=UPI00095632E7|nr:MULTISPECIES: PAS domain-containing hybrid sensor histidine kinase/response regulator [unclassified Bosea (in: a-proteobacteria)]TAJ29633.1 MAG: hybrid sensor histidine kinase/response regulator [Bosea sp. (in: a-proteobacteria)]SIQ04035.1 Na+/proline symporter [Bosea sp. TND4EK4]